MARDALFGQQAAPQGIGGGILELAGRQVAAGDDEPHRALEGGQALGHARRQGKLGGRPGPCPGSHLGPEPAGEAGAKAAERGGQSHLAGQQFAPEGPIEETPAIVMFDQGAGFAFRAAHPRVQEHQPADPRIAGRIEENGRGGIAEPQERDPLETR